MEMINYFIGIVLVVGAFLFAYVSSVVVHEQKTGKTHRMFWEKKEENYDGKLQNGTQQKGRHELLYR